jgi:type IV secretion system protein VirB9
MKHLIAFLALLLAAPAIAQVPPSGPGEDSRVQLLDYASGGIFHVQTAPDTIQTVLLAPGEQIRSVIVSDPSTYAITVAGSGDAFSLKPNGANALTMVNVRTDQRSYDLELAASGTGPVASIIRFTYGDRPKPPPMPTNTPIQKVEGVSWKLSGSRELRPADVSDDGVKTYIAWRSDQEMPAVFSVGPGLSERIVDGYVRNGLFTIDRVHNELVFRIDREVARAQRIKKRGRHERNRDSSPRSAG